MVGHGDRVDASGLAHDKLWDVLHCPAASVASNDPAFHATFVPALAAHAASVATCSAIAAHWTDLPVCVHQRPRGINDLTGGDCPVQCQRRPSGHR